MLGPDHHRWSLAHRAPQGVLEDALAEPGGPRAQKTGTSQHSLGQAGGARMWTASTLGLAALVHVEMAGQQA